MKDTATPTLQPLVGQERAAQLLGGLSVRTLERWRLEGRGPRFVRCGRRVMYNVPDLEAFIAKSTRSSTRGTSAAA